MRNRKLSPKERLALGRCALITMDANQTSSIKIQERLVADLESDAASEAYRIKRDKAGTVRGRYAKNPKSLNKRLVIMVDTETELFAKEHKRLVCDEIRKLVHSLRNVRLTEINSKQEI